GAPLYPGDARSCSSAERQRRMAAGEPYALRLDMTAAMARTGPLTWIETGDGSKTGSVTANPQMWGDVVLARKEMPTSYHLWVVVDDAHQGVTRVVRGRICSPRPACTGCCRRCSACRHPPTITTGKSSRNRPARPPCGRCARLVRAQPTSGGWSGLREAVAGGLSAWQSAPWGCDGETKDIRWQAAASGQARDAPEVVYASSARDRGDAGGRRP